MLPCCSAAAGPCRHTSDQRAGAGREQLGSPAVWLQLEADHVRHQLLLQALDLLVGGQHRLERGGVEHIHLWARRSGVPQTGAASCMQCEGRKEHSCALQERCHGAHASAPCQQAAPQDSRTACGPAFLAGTAGGAAGNQRAAWGPSACRWLGLAQTAGRLGTAWARWAGPRRPGHDRHALPACPPGRCGSRCRGSAAGRTAAAAGS